MTRRFALSLSVGADQEWRWGFAGDDTTYAGSCDAGNREDAVVSALAEAHGDLVADGPVEVVLTLHESSPLWRLADEVMALFDGVLLVAFTDADTTLRKAAQRAAQPAPEPEGALPLTPLVVATDGSSARGRIGWGWLGSDGSHGCGAVRAPECAKVSQPLLAELRAISEAIEANPGRQLHIRSDCTHALTLIDDWLAGSDRMPFGYQTTHHAATRRGGLVRMRDQVRRERARLDLAWVRGHAGDALNEGADSLAKLARRAPEGTWGYGEEEVPSRAESIALTFTSAARQSVTAA